MLSQDQITHDGQDMMQPAGSDKDHKAEEAELVEMNEEEAKKTNGTTERDLVCHEQKIENITANVDVTGNKDDATTTKDEQEENPIQDETTEQHPLDQLKNEDDTLANSDMFSNQNVESDEEEIENAPVTIITSDDFILSGNKISNAVTNSDNMKEADDKADDTDALQPMEET